MCVCFGPLTAVAGLAGLTPLEKAGEPRRGVALLVAEIASVMNVTGRGRVGCKNKAL